jgi:cell shape-determining protein MreC
MNSSFYNKRSSHSNGSGSAARIGVMLLLVLGLLGLLGLYAPKVVSPTLIAVASPIWKVWDRTWQYLGGGTGEEVADLNERVRELELDLSSAKRQIADMQDIEQIFAQARLDLSDAPAVRVIKKPPSIPYDSIILGSGRDVGINVGDLIVAMGDIVLGEVVRVYARASTAMLYSSPGREVDILLGPRALALVAKGRGGGVFQVQIPRESEVSEGHDVMLQSIFPLHLGEVAYVYSEPTDSFKTAVFRISANLSELKWVRVVSADSELQAISLDAMQFQNTLSATTSASTTKKDSP